MYAQLGQQPLVRTTETSLEPRPGTLSCLSARPPADLAFWTGTRPRVVGVSPSIAPFLYTKRTALSCVMCVCGACLCLYCGGVMCEAVVKQTATPGTALFTKIKHTRSQRGCPHPESP